MNQITKKQTLLNKIIGILQIFVFASIAYSTYIVALGTNGLAPKVLLVPQVGYGLFLIYNKFTN